MPKNLRQNNVSNFIGGLILSVIAGFLFKLNAYGNGLLYSTYTGAAMTGRL